MPVYLDHNATTPLHEDVAEAMLPFMGGVYGNPSSVHRYGRLTRDALEQARTQVARLVGAEPNELIFTSGGTEANNLAIKGVLANQPATHFAVSAIEHASIMEPARSMTQQHWELDMIPVNTQGQVETEMLLSSLQANTRLVSVMSANNETGAVQDIKSLLEVTRANNASTLFHSDACQLAGKQVINFSEMGLDLMSLSSHKIYGPQGAGALVVKRSVDLSPQLTGGGQEKALRSGTENLLALVGFGRAAELAGETLVKRQLAAQGLQELLIEHLQAMRGVEIFSQSVERIANTVQFSLQGIDGEALLMALDRKGFAVSSGSACDSAKTQPSHVLLAMSVNEQTARGAIRVSFGEQNTEDDVTRFIEALMTIRQQYNLDI